RCGEALGLLEAADGQAVAALAISGEASIRWARGEVVQAAAGRSGRVLVLVFAPSRSGELVARATAAFGLTPLEARIAEAFLSAPSLAIAASQAGVGRETARDAMERVMAKTGARRSTDVVRKLTELMSAVHGEPEPSQAVMQAAFGLTPAEAGVAVQLAAGATQKEAARVLGLQPETVRTYAKGVLAKTGAARTKDLVRLATETQALSRLAAVAEPVFTSGGPPARLRLVPRDGGRGVAFLDYGPVSGRPAIVFHGFVAGRSLPPALARGLQARGYRPVVPQRPGFGLTSPARGAYLTEACEDLTGLVERLGGERVALFARDGGVAAALAFASAFPERIARAVLLNPRSPAGISREAKTGPVARMARLILSRPQVIAGLGEFIRRRTRSDFLEAALRETLKALPADVAALEDAAIRAQLVRDIQAQFAHGCEGYVAEHSLYAAGWRPPRVEGGGPWTVAYSGAFGREPPHEPWSDLPG
ncbi:MAG: alpha/beta fold hydrolase, partial [Proteobacteria bacterium]|nr:alpha/beta fold hydrolase [Pseudomonadota bacterium]